MMFLKQSTAVDVMLGPFVDDTDGKTTEEALTLAQADLHLSKNGAASAQKNDATSATHRYGGNYMVDLNTTDTNTLGHLRLMCKKTGALPVVADFMVLPAEAYDTLINGTDSFTVDLSTQAKADVNAECDTALTDYDAATGTEMATAQADLDTITGTDGVTLATAQGNYAPAKVSDVPTAAANADAVLDEALSGHVTAGTLGKAVADIETDTNELQSDDVPGLIAGLNDIAATDVWSAVTRTLTANTNLNDPTAAVIADAVLDEALSGHVTAGTLGKAVADIEADTNELQTDNVPGLIAALNDISVADILTTQMTEAYAADGVAPTLAQALFLIQQTIGDFSISGTVLTAKKLDGSTAAATYTLDDAVTPTSRTRAT